MITKIEKAIKRLKELQREGDTEKAHGEADDVLCKLLPKRIVDEYNKIEKWYA